MAAGAKCSAVTRLEWMLGSNDDDDDEGDLLRCYQVALQIWCHLMIRNRQVNPTCCSSHCHNPCASRTLTSLMVCCMYHDQQATLRIFAKQTVHWY